MYGGETFRATDLSLHPVFENPGNGAPLTVSAFSRHALEHRKDASRRIRVGVHTEWVNGRRRCTEGDATANAAGDTTYDMVDIIPDSRNSGFDV